MENKNVSLSPRQSIESMNRRSDGSIIDQTNTGGFGNRDSYVSIIEGNPDEIQDIEHEPHSTIILAANLPVLSMMSDNLTENLPIPSGVSQPKRRKTARDTERRIQPRRIASLTAAERITGPSNQNVRTAATKSRSRSRSKRRSGTPAKAGRRRSKKGKGRSRSRKRSRSPMANMK